MVKLVTLAQRIELADGPEAYKVAVCNFLESLVEDCNTAADHVSSAWQEKAPAVPWESLARHFDSFKSQLEEIDVWADLESR